MPFQVQHHPLAYTAQEVAASEHIPGKIMAKVVIAYADGTLVKLAMPASRRVDTAKAARALEAREVRLAQEQVSLQRHLFGSYSLAAGMSGD